MYTNAAPRKTPNTDDRVESQEGDGERFVEGGVGVVDVGAGVETEGGICWSGGEGGVIRPQNSFLKKKSIRFFILNYAPSMQIMKIS